MEKTFSYSYVIPVKLRTTTVADCDTNQNNILNETKLYHTNKFMQYQTMSFDIIKKMIMAQGFKPRLLQFKSGVFAKLNDPKEN
jgi:hypothetical protein